MDAIRRVLGRSGAPSIVLTSEDEREAVERRLSGQERRLRTIDAQLHFRDKPPPGHG